MGTTVGLRHVQACLTARVSGTFSEQAEEKEKEMGCLDGMLHRDRNDGQASASVSTARLAGRWEQACPWSQLLPCPVLDPMPRRQCPEWGHTREDIVPIVNMHDFIF